LRRGTWNLKRHLAINCRQIPQMIREFHSDHVSSLSGIL
jgi:hypothetical protein